MYKIYKIKNKKHPLEIYIGSTKQTLKRRFQSHAAGKGSACYPYIQKYGKENFEITVIDYADTEEESLEKEEFWTIFFKEQGYFLYNKYVGNKMSEEVKQIISKVHKGNNKGMIGKNHPMYGKHHSSETKAKIRMAIGGENSPLNKQVRCIENNKIYESCTAAAKDLNCSISMVAKVAKGKRKSIHGLHFEYI